MVPLPIVTPRHLIAALGKAGFFIHHVRGSHHFLKHPSNSLLRVTVAYHSKPLKRGTLRAILRQANMSTEELIELL